MPEGQHTENLAWIRKQLGGRSPRAAGLARLLQAALNGEGELLRVSPQRTVLRLDASDPEAAPHGWLLKIFHPQRSAEALRRLVSMTPAQREHEAWQRLAARVSIPLRADSEQLRPQLGLFARAYWQGAPALPDADTAAGLAQLHAVRWLDRDLALDDLLWWIDAEGERQLLPLDLGHARVAAAPLPPEHIYLALARLLSGLHPEQASAWAPKLLSAHEEFLSDWEVEALVQRSIKLRSRRSWRRSARALRSCSDFLAVEGGVRRRGFDAPPPSWPCEPTAQQIVLAQGPRSTSLRDGELVWKFYPRPGAGQVVRRALGAGPGRQAYRQLALLEILGIGAAQALAWLKHPQGEWIATAWIEGESADLASTCELADWLAELHGFGFGMRDMKCSNFRRIPGRQGASAWALVDGDGITPRLEDPARDLARLIAEHPADGESTAALQTRYFAKRGPATPSFLQRLTEKTALFRAKLAAADQAP